MNHMKLAAVALATSAVAASGCGSSKPSSATTSTAAGSSASQTESAHSGPLTRAELIAQADTICRRINQKRVTTNVAPTQTYASALAPLAAYEQAAVAQMHKLIPPPSMARDWNQIVASAQTIADIYTAAVHYAKTGKLDETATLSAKEARATERMLAAAKRQGFKDCAQRNA